MHAQIKASPDTIAENIRAVVNALADRNVNIEAIAPDFNPPHVRVLLKHEHSPGSTDGPDPNIAAIDALTRAGLNPTVVRAVLPVRMPNRPKALQTAMDALESQSHVIDSILVMPGSQGGKALVSFGVAGDMSDDWEAQSEVLRDFIETALKNLP
jgi:hypothetical protein